MCAGHGAKLWGASPEWGHNRKPLAKCKAYHRKVEAEGSARQISGLMNTNFIRRQNEDEFAKQI